MSVVEVESKWNPNAIGKHGEIGLMQIRPQYASVSRHELFDPVKNLKEGMRILSNKKKRCPSVPHFTTCYNRGVSGANRMTNPHSDEYKNKINTTYKQYIAKLQGKL